MTVARDGRLSVATWGIWLAVISAATSSVSGPLARSLNDTGWSPAALTGVRTLGAGLVLLVPAALALRGRWTAARSGLSGIVLLGAIGVAGTSICYYNAVTLLPISVALMVQYSAPVLVLVYSSLRRRHVPRRMTLVGVGLAMIGLAVVVGIGGAADTHPLGLLWAMSGAVCFAVYFMVSEATAVDLPPVALASATLLVGGVTVGLGCLLGLLEVTTSTDRVDLGSAELAWLWPLALLILVPTVVTYSTSMASVGILGARISSFISLSELAFAVATAWLLVGETPRWIQLVGGTVLVAGIVLVRLGDAETHHAGMLDPDSEGVSTADPVD